MTSWMSGRWVAAAALGLGIAIAGAALAPEPPKQAVEVPELLDYLIQDVCVDSAQRPISGDPAVCKRHRNVRLGEKLPFIVADFDRKAGITYSSMSSIPVRATDGSMMVLVIKSLQGRYTPDYSFNFSRGRDAFDLIDISNSRYASIVRTFDGGCFDQVFSRNGNAKGMANRAGGWVLFPLAPSPSNWPPNGSLRLTTWRMQVSPAGPQCASNHATGMTLWTRPSPYTFETGKTLSALRTDHFATDLEHPENSFERFFFTREYGMTRWESWWTVAHCHKTLGADSPRCGQTSANPLRARCSVLKLPSNATAGHENWGGQSWVRMDCRDTTRYVALKRPQLPLSPEIATGGGLVDIDYSVTVGRQ